MGCTSWSFSET